MPASISHVPQEENSYDDYDEEYVELICNGWSIDPEHQEDEPAVINARYLGVNASLRRTASCQFSITSSDCQSSILPRPRTRVITSCDVKDLVGAAAFYNGRPLSESISSFVSGQ